ncbi:MAG: MucB/RseB C-terminal domain-containing protein [Gammaproteobacteria bacterium]|nr:MucB/RseB C-terminal domain-containing protein [Gammaproteobacteria bacterium]MBU1777396.1 MucB/RseB C-terminal domain-containing protein [Gammaproteobacteria bacterium]MBU1967898.1 MucB/RseB C-terminal domain-containing protein [Gammaproteobacteria bacterium]
MQIFAFLLILMGMGAANADPVPTDESNWLKTMAFAAHRIDFSGVFIHQAGGNIEMSRITHVTDEDGEHERLEGLDGGRRELIRSNDQVWLFANGKRLRAERRQFRKIFPSLLPEQITALNENYFVRQAEEDEVAGYHAHTVVFQPRDGLRYTRKMWAHSDSGLLLKAAVLDGHGYIIEQHAFVQLAINGKFDRSWIIRDAAPAEEADRQLRLSSMPQGDPAPETGDWQVDSLPSGFRKIASMRRTFRENQEPVIHMVFSDGLAGISVFIEKVSGMSHFHSGLAGQGATHVYNRMVDDSMVTVIGEVPARTVILVAESVRYAGR